MNLRYELEFSLLGPLEVRVAGRRLELGGVRARQRAVLGCLLVHAGEVVSTDRLIDALWGERPPASAKTVVQGHIAQLRRLLEPARGKGEPAEVLVTLPAGYLLRVEEGALDRDRFQALLAEGADALAAARVEQAAGLLRQALELWRGPALGDLAYESWARAEAERLEELRLVCLEERVEAELRLGRHAELVGELEALVATEPLRERPRGQLMRALYAAGQQAEALEAYREARGVLVGELGIEPSPALRDLEAAILRQDERLAAPERARRYRTNLPLGATALVGREAELGEAGAILRDRNVRLLTLTGPGGIGKTRLALALALAHATRDGDETPWFSDGACWVPLAALRDPSLVLPTIAGVLEIESAQSSTADALVQFLAGGRLLLVLDNAEHLLPEIALELAPLQQVDGPTLLVTSRERLHLSGEHVYPVPPLAQQEAVALFLARAAQHGASVSAESAVEELCARLDRLPLALELAAARTPVFSPSQLLDRLGRALDLLTGERDTDSRQQTLRASIAWSHDLLDEAEKRLFAYMSVFAGGCTIEAAEQVCATDIDTLASLVDKSLVRRASSDAVAEPRFWMLETIREYAAERLESRGEAIELRRRHAAHFLALAEQADPELWGPRQRAWFDRLAVEHDNMRAALAWGIAAREPELAIRLIGALEPFWEARGHVAEARGWFADARAAGIEASPGAYAKALYGISRLAGLQGDRIEERELLEHAIRLAREAGTTRELILALAHLGNALEPAGDADRARELHTESVAIARTDGDPWALALALNNFGYWLGVHGEPEAARPLVEESLELRRALGEQRGIAITLTTLGELAIGEGNYEAATAQLEESLALAAEIGNRHLEALSACELGLIAVYRQQQAKAYEHLVRGLDLSGELGFAGDAAIGLAAVAALAAGEGDTDRAARLWGASEALFEETGTGGEPQLRELMERILPEARSSGDEAAFGRALEAGRRLSLADAVAYALEPHAPG